MTDFPKHYTHTKNDKLPDRVANTPTEAVNLEARGYTLAKPVEVKAEKAPEPKAEPKHQAQNANRTN